MKIVKFCLIPILLLIAAAFGFGMMAPDGWDVSVSVEIEAPPEVIFPYIDELARWEQWTHLSESGNSRFTFTYEGPTRGLGAIAVCSGPGSNVRWQVTSSNEQEGIRFDELLEGSTPAKGAILFEPMGAVTKVTWTDKGSLGTFPLIRYFHDAMQNSLSAAYTRNLDGLKGQVEFEQKRAQAEQ
jgi:hypothetical protein